MPESVRLYNTFTRSVDPFQPIYAGEVRMYCCGPTVYSYAHLGNMRAYLFEDVLHRTLEKAGYQVKHVMNVTDVGHLTSDSDEGDDKMLKAAEREQKGVLEIAKKYENAFFEDCTALNIKRPTIVCRATEHVQDMIDFVKDLQDKGYAYVAGGNVYFDTSKYKGYGELARLDLDNLQHGKRVDTDPNKRNPTDFVLWFTDSKFENQILRWDSPWGVGYPGWHIECSTMSMKYLGERIDIHCGGVDHIPVHHENERCQSEARIGHKWVNVWMHNEFLNMLDGKMSKSKGDTLRVQTLIDKGYNPLAFRYLFLTTHYRFVQKFSFEILDSAQAAYNNFRNKIIELKKNAPAFTVQAEALEETRKQFNACVFNDLNTSQALVVMWNCLKDEGLNPATKLAAVQDMDQVLGLGVDAIQEEKAQPVDAQVEDLLKKRKQAREAKDWAAADQIRDALAALGYVVKDLPNGETQLMTLTKRS